MQSLSTEFTPQQAKVLLHEVERIRLRRAMEASLAEFAKQAWHVLEPAQPLAWNWHLDTICGYLEALADRKILRLIINVPPGSMKSLLGSVMFSAWTWARQPSHRFLCGSNDHVLATRDNLRTRRLVESEWYQGYWGSKITIASDQGEKTLFENTAGGFRQSQGVRQIITGKRGDTTIWDDPHDVRLVESEKQRNDTLESWDVAWSNRQNNPGKSATLFIMQRSHTADICGHVTSKEQDWKQLVIAMRYDGQRYDAGKDIGRPDLNDPRQEGELMFPERFPESVVKEAEEDLGSYGTAAQHQQSPAPKGGGEIKPEWFRRYQSRSDDDKGLRYILVDPAGEKKAGRHGRKDNTAMAVFETRADGNIYLIDAVRDRIGLIGRTDILFKWHAQYKPQAVGYEQYGMQSDIAHMNDRMEREQYRFPIEPLGGGLRKEDRIRQVIPRLERGGIWFPTSLPRRLTNGKNVDIMELIIKEEVMTFPVARYDDFLDLMARLEDLAIKNLLKFPALNGKPMRTTPKRSGNVTWMSR